MIIPQSGRVADAIQAFFYYLLRLLPSEWASAIGSAGIRWNARVNRPDIIENAKRNLRRHRPGASEAEIAAMVEAFLDGVGRVAAEFAVLHRFKREGRLTVLGMESLKALHGSVPIVAICVHTGNWEAFSPVFQAAGITLHSIIEPPANAFERFAVDQTRRNFGVDPILPDLAGIRKAIRVLKAKGVVSIFPDEARKGHTMAPLFGRKPHDQGNLAIVSRLARISKAKLVLGYCQRIGKCRFELRFSEVFELPERASPDPLADVAFLNGIIEPVILSQIPRWYFLDDSLEPIENSASEP